jgi:hypothetical protein
VWRNCLQMLAAGMFATCRAASTPGVAQDTHWSRGECQGMITTL